MSVPDEAVEAACASFFLGLNHIHPESKADMRAALEAAAPYMLREAQAEAWSEGSHFGGLYPVVFQNDNPYRSQA